MIGPKITSVKKRDDNITTIDLGNRLQEFEGTYKSVESKGSIEMPDFSKITGYGGNGLPIVATKTKIILELTRPDGGKIYKLVDE